MVVPTNHRKVFLWIERGYRDWLFCIRQASVLFMSGLIATLSGVLQVTHLPVIYQFPPQTAIFAEGKLAHNRPPTHPHLLH
jgi:hypothetical protein